MWPRGGGGGRMPARRTPLGGAAVWTRHPFPVRGTGFMNRSLLAAGLMAALALGACEKKPAAPATPPPQGGGGTGSTPAGSPSVFDSARNQVSGAADKAAAALKEGRDQAAAASKTALDDLK